MQVTVYSKIECGHCVRAMNALNNRKIPFTELKLGRDFNREELLEQVPTAKTFPVILIDGKHIGGADQLIKLLGE